MASILLVGSDASQPLDLTAWAGEIWAISGSVKVVPRCDYYICRYNQFFKEHVTVAIGKGAGTVHIMAQNAADVRENPLKEMRAAFPHVTFHVDTATCKAALQEVYAPYGLTSRMILLGTAAIVYALQAGHDVHVTRFSLAGGYANDNGTGLATHSHILEIERYYLKTQIAAGRVRLQGATLPRPLVPELRMLAIIPARRGSKGLPGKNMMLLEELPLVYWALAAARNSAYQLDIAVSTDDPAVMEYCARIGAPVPFVRPAELAQDATASVPVMEHAVVEMEKLNSCRYNYIILVQPTSPLREPQDIDAAVTLALEHDAPAVLSITEAPCHPYLVYKKDVDGGLSRFMPQPGGVPRRQDRPVAWWENGAVYVARRDVLMEQHTLWPDGLLGYVMPKDRAVDVDDRIDLFTARVTLRENELETSKRGAVIESKTS